MLKAGDVVMIYCDPYTCNDPEGLAELVTLWEPANNDGIATWSVVFVDAPADGLFLRAVTPQ